MICALTIFTIGGTMKTLKTEEVYYATFQARKTGIQVDWQQTDRGEI